MTENTLDIIRYIHDAFYNSIKRRQKSSFRRAVNAPWMGK